jgi:hypothetical protein
MKIPGRSVPHEPFDPFRGRSQPTPWGFRSAKNPARGTSNASSLWVRQPEVLPGERSVLKNAGPQGSASARE